MSRLDPECPDLCPDKEDDGGWIILDEKDDLSLDVLFDMAEKGTVLITQDNKPVFALVAVNEEDLQTWQLGQNQGFLALMRRSWDRLQAEGGVPLAEARQRLSAENRR